MKVLLIGPIAHPDLPSPGGYESANRRIVDGLRERGIDIEELPYKIEGRRLGKIGSYVNGVLHTLKILLQHKGRRYVLVHVTSVQKHFLYYEYILRQLCKWFGFKFVFDLRAGSAEIHYHKRGQLYKKTFQNLVQNADLLLIEGKEYEEFLYSLESRKPKYFPNFIHLSPENDKAWKRENHEIGICYVGRVVREKGIGRAIEVVEMVNRLGLPARLHIIGTGSEEYLYELKETVVSLECEHVVKFYGNLPFQRIYQILAKMHFFVYISMHEGEGHSNALTEAMSFGVVPICSDRGFSRSVVSNAGRVLSEAATTEEYAKALSGIWNRNEWDWLSEQCIQRVSANYSAEPVLEKLMTHYNEVMGIA